MGLCGEGMPYCSCGTTTEKTLSLVVNVLLLEVALGGPPQMISVTGILHGWETPELSQA